MAPEGQAKVVTCAHGEFDDVIVDIRVGSPTFGRHEVVHLAAGEERSVYVPVGVAHGFCVTSEIGALDVSALVTLQRDRSNSRSIPSTRELNVALDHRRRGDRESQGRRRRRRLRERRRRAANCRSFTEPSSTGEYDARRC